ncbi:hypothetical protein M409DRAFT_55007 [Zasmidium cellare ATCC 36951]|uniref:Uncharacterized protein n=1 Tax=Zasmidium cellare ATCC 36951 TaxID=1080233 RepID=A0A6A6CKK6_ZASCE|nr:uncharacterized protein M409DRAFT_55007 [Zasmidium cellare ATCC 36951]KAF2166690.1 hypothetical protein M409DRAFT_55007 [Zasmidium cellare ATCC 36951]
MFTNHSALGELLCWHIIGEGLEEYIWRYLALQNQQQHSSSVLKPNSLVHTERLLADTASAHFEWTGRKCAEPSLRVLERAINTFPVQQRRADGICYVALEMVIKRIILDRTLQPYPGQFFDLFIDLRRLTIARIVREQEISRLMLWHPTTPDAEPMLRYVQGDLSELSTIWRASMPALNAFGSDLFRASYILEKQGRTEGAAWLNFMVESRVPAVWHKRIEVWKQFDNDPKLDCIRKQEARNSGYNT